MKPWLFTALASGVLATANGQRPASGISSGSASDAQISVHLYNLSGIPAHTLERATHEASRVFAQSGVNILWETGDSEAEEAHSTDQSAPAAFRDRHVRSYLVVRIGRGMALHVPSGALGVSLPYAQFGVSATIFQERVETLCSVAGQDFAVLLGHAIAHELGHVALASHGHAPTGIMRASWRRADFEQAAFGHLGFTTQQGAEIRDYVARRDQVKTPLMTAPNSESLLAAGPQMNVAVCNMEGVRDSIVARAKVETGLVYSAAGVTIVWHYCDSFPSPTQQQREPWFIVRLRTGKPPLTVGPASLDVMGKAYLAEAGGGTLADAYLEAIQAMSEQYQNDQSALLGFVMAHELGHLLLGPGHTSEGVMQRTWGPTQMFALNKRWMKFSKEGAAQVRRALEARTTARDEGK